MKQKQGKNEERDERAKANLRSQYALLVATPAERGARRKPIRNTETQGGWTHRKRRAARTTARSELRELRAYGFVYHLLHLVFPGGLRSKN